MFIDTHCHLNMMVEKKEGEPLKSEQFVEIKQIVSRAKAAGVEKIINVGTSLAESKNSIAIAQENKNIFSSVGIHPCDIVDKTWRSQLKELEELLKEKEKNKIVAVGETGLDYYHKPYNEAEQKDAFVAHIELALKFGLPVVVHVRSSADDVLRILEPYKGSLRGVNHCFQQEQYVADQLVGWGFYIGVDAPITYSKSERLREVLASVPLSSIILETDAPFLPPQQMRGKKNSPEYIPLFAATLAEVKGVTMEELGVNTTMNAESLFGI